MNLRIVSVFAAVALLAACESAPEGNKAAAGAGQVTPPPAAKMATGGIQAGSAEDFKVNVGDRVFYGYDKSDLTAESKAALDRQSAWLKKYPNYAITVEGHCDERGTREYNLALGERRANAAKEYLVASGITASRVKTISYGKERPEVLGSSEDAYSKNRRAVTVLQ